MKKTLFRKRRGKKTCSLERSEKKKKKNISEKNLFLLLISLAYRRLLPSQIIIIPFQNAISYNAI